MIRLIPPKFFLRKPQILCRLLSTAQARCSRVAVVGSSGGIGQPLALLLKLDPLVTELSLYDIQTPGVGMDLSHIDTDCFVEDHIGGMPEMKKALSCAKVVIVSAGQPRQPGMARTDLLPTNAYIIADLCEAIAAACPKAQVGIITNPVSTLVCVAAELLKQKGCYDPKRLFGINSLDLVRAKTFVAGTLEIDPKKVYVPVIGGHSPDSCVPLLSQSTPEYKGDAEEAKAMTKHIKYAGVEVINAKAGGGSATLAMAYSAHRFVHSQLRGLKGEYNVRDTAFIECNHCEGIPFFACEFTLGPEGVKDILSLPRMNAYEMELLDIAVAAIKKEVQTGMDLVKSDLYNRKKKDDSSKDKGKGKGKDKKK